MTLETADDIVQPVATEAPRSDQYRVDQPPFSRRRQPFVVQQEDHISERRLPHQIEDVVPSDSDVGRAGVDNRGAPRIHSSGSDISR